MGVSIAPTFGTAVLDGKLYVYVVGERDF